MEHSKRGLSGDCGGRLIRIAISVVFVLTIFAGILQAGGKDAVDINEPNEVWLSRWDIPVNDANDANELMITKYKAVIAALQNKDLDLGLKEKIIEKIMRPIFDFELMSKLSLGKTHWSKLKAPEQKRFTELFTKHMKKSYLGNIKLYKDETAVFRPAVPEKTGISIAMDFISNDARTSVIYKLRRIEKKWKIYDVEIEGVSILMTYRSQFEDILKHGNVKDLFDHLEKEPD
jgi:phospholipid transport system substrate-binding protein